jgi:hypothetical protein
MSTILTLLFFLFNVSMILLMMLEKNPIKMLYRGLCKIATLLPESQENEDRREMIEDAIRYSVEEPSSYKTRPFVRKQGGLAYNGDDFTLQLTPEKDEVLNTWSGNEEGQRRSAMY